MQCLQKHNLCPNFHICNGNILSSTNHNAYNQRIESSTIPSDTEGTEKYIADKS